MTRGDAQGRPVALAIGIRPLARDKSRMRPARQLLPYVGLDPNFLTPAVVATLLVNLNTQQDWCQNILHN